MYPSNGAECGWLTGHQVPGIRHEHRQHLTQTMDIAHKVGDGGDEGEQQPRGLGKQGEGGARKEACPPKHSRLGVDGGDVDDDACLWADMCVMGDGGNGR